MWTIIPISPVVVAAIALTDPQVLLDDCRLEPLLSCRNPYEIGSLPVICLCYVQHVVLLLRDFVGSVADPCRGVPSLRKKRLLLMDTQPL